MELDFKTVRALSSPTRIKILDQVLDSEETPTTLSDSLDRSKSTISSHLETLQEAGLVEKDEEEGRRRVVYHPTGKAENIVKGREKKVKFSLASSFVSGFAGLALVGNNLLNYGTNKAQSTALNTQAEYSADGMNAMAENAPEAGRTAADAATTLDVSTALLLLGVSLISVSVLGFAYGFMMRQLDS